MSEVMSIAHSGSISRGNFSLLPGKQEKLNQGFQQVMSPEASYEFKVLSTNPPIAI